MNTFDDHQTMVVQALMRTAAAIADTESSFDRRVATLQDRADRLTFIYQTPLNWCVEPWSTAYRNAKTGNITSISSPFVTTGRNGYRFCLRVYPFGHDSGQSACSPVTIVESLSFHTF